MSNKDIKVGIGVAGIGGLGEAGRALVRAMLSGELNGIKVVDLSKYEGFGKGQASSCDCDNCSDYGRCMVPTKKPRAEKVKEVVARLTRVEIAKFNVLDRRGEELSRMDNQIEELAKMYNSMVDERNKLMDKLIEGKDEFWDEVCAYHTLDRDGDFQIDEDNHTIVKLVDKTN